MDDLVKRARIMSGMIQMGERIEFGSDSAMLDASADRIEALERELALIAVVVDPMWQAKHTKPEAGWIIDELKFNEAENSKTIESLERDWSESQQSERKLALTVQSIAMSLGSSDEWSDLDNMLSDTTRRVGALAAELEQAKSELAEVNEKLFISIEDEKITASFLETATRQRGNEHSRADRLAAILRLVCEAAGPFIKDVWSDELNDASDVMVNAKLCDIRALKAAVASIPPSLLSQADLDAITEAKKELGE